MKTYSTHPIDIDFAGWSIVDTGEHNCWGIVDNEGFLIGHCSLKSPADYAANKLNELQPSQPRLWFINAIKEGMLLA